MKFEKQSNSNFPFPRAILYIYNFQALSKQLCCNMIAKTVLDTEHFTLFETVGSPVSENYFNTLLKNLCGNFCKPNYYSIEVSRNAAISF